MEFIRKELIMLRTMNFGDVRTARILDAGPLLHVRFAGQSFDVPLATMDIGVASDDVQIKRAIATRLLVAEERLVDYVIDRHANGNLTIRPMAVFG
jgi:hypothetical protein